MEINVNSNSFVSYENPKKSKLNSLASIASYLNDTNISENDRSVKNTLYTFNNRMYFEYNNSESKSAYPDSVTINRDVDRESIIDNINKDENTMVTFLEAYSETGEQVSFAGSVGYVENFDSENPIMIVRGIDEEGYYEAYVDIKKIDITSCSKIEKEALQAYYGGEQAKINGGSPLDYYFPCSWEVGEKTPNECIETYFRFNLLEAITKTVGMGNANTSSALAFFDEFFA